MTLDETFQFPIEHTGSWGEVSVALLVPEREEPARLATFSGRQFHLPRVHANGSQPDLTSIRLASSVPVSSETSSPGTSGGVTSGAGGRRRPLGGG